MKSGRTMCIAFALAAALPLAGSEVYQVTANGITDGIDLTSMEGYDALSLAGPASGDLYMTGTVTHAEASTTSPFTLVGNGGGLNMFSTGLLSDPLAFTGSSGYFDFQNENITLGDDWEDRLQLPVSASFYVSFKQFHLSGGTDADPLVFAPSCRWFFDGTSSIGYQGGNSRVKAAFNRSNGCFWSSSRGHKRSNGVLYIGGVDTEGGVPGYVDLEVTNGVFYCYRAYFSQNVTSANSTQAALGLTNTVTVGAGGTYQYGKTYRYGPDWVLFRFAGGYFQQNGYYGEMCNDLENSAGDGGYIFESVDGSTIKVSPHASSCGTSSRIVTCGDGDVLITANGTDANENYIGGKFEWNHGGDVCLGQSNSGSMRISAENALPYGEGKGDVLINCRYLCLDASQTVNSIYGAAKTYARNSGVTVTVGADGGDCRYKMPIKMAIGESITYTDNGRTSTRTNYGWDVAKTGAGTMTLESSVQKTLAVNEGSVSVVEDVSVPTLTVAAEASLSVASGGILRLDSFDNANDAEVAVESGGTLLFFATNDVTRIVDLSGYTLAKGAVVGQCGAGKVIFDNLPTGVSLLAEEGELELASIASGAKAETTTIVVEDGATLTVDSGIALKTVSLTVRGVAGAESTAYGGDGTALEGLVGGGTVYVMPRTFTWTGAGSDANISTPANWEGGVAPMLYTGLFNAVFPADAAQTDVVVDEDAFFEGVSIAGVSYSFTGADAVFAFGTNGLAVAEPADGASPVYDFSVKVAQSGAGAWQMPTESTESKIYFRRPLVDGASAGSIYTSGSKFYFHSTNSTYTGDIYITNATAGAVYAYGSSPFGTNGLLTVRSCGSSAVLTLTDTVIGNDVALNVQSSNPSRRRSINFSGATNEFCGAYYNISGGAENNQYKGVVIFHKGYGTEDNIGYVNWADNRTTGEVHMLGKFLAGTLEGTMAVHFHVASNRFGNISAWSGTYAISPMGTKFDFHVDDAFYRSGYNVAVTGTWDFHGTDQRVGSLYSYESAAYMRSFDGPGRLRCCHTKYFGDLSKSRGGLADYLFKGIFQGEMSFKLEEDSTQKLVMSGVSTATGTVEVAGGTLCFTNGASWTSATNVVVSGSGVLETYDANTFGKGADMRMSGSATWNGHGASQRVRFLYVEGVRQPLGVYCAEDYEGATSAMRKTPFVSGTGLLLALGDGTGTTLILR